MSSEGNFHISVMVKEVLEGLAVKSGGKYIDCNLGGGGHTAEIMKRGGFVLGIDCDQESISYVERNFERQINDGKLLIRLGNFSRLGELAKSCGFNQVDGILYDLGLSSFQLERSGRGFSFQRHEPLDMRMDNQLKVRASDLVNGLSKYELCKLFEQFGEEQHSWAVAQAIVSARALEPIVRTDQLANVVREVLGYKRGSLHPATRVFQALRLAVNQELFNASESFKQAIELLGSGGRLVIISFHSLEDRLSKNLRENKCLVPVNRKPIIPSGNEILANPRCHSAKMRIYEKI